MGLKIRPSALQINAGLKSCRRPRWTSPQSAAGQPSYDPGPAHGQQPQRLAQPLYYLSIDVESNKFTTLIYVCLVHYDIMHLFIHLLIHSFIHSFIHPSIHSFIPSSIPSFIFSCIHSFMHLSVYAHVYIQIYSNPEQDRKIQSYILKW